MDDELTQVLRMVADGQLSPEEAEPLVTAVTEGSEPSSRPSRRTSQAERRLRLQVFESGRPVVNLRIPMSLAGLADSLLPGLSTTHAARVREAIRSGVVGPIIEVQDEDGDGVVISAE